jgi:uncharacterized protein
MSEEFERELEAFRAARLSRLKQPHGWLTLCGLHWLEAGDNRIEGLPGLFVLEGGAVRLEAQEGDGWTLQGAPVTSRALQSDAAGKPDKLERGPKALQVIERGGRLALRLWDASLPVLQTFAGIAAWPGDPSYRVEAAWEAYPQPRRVEVPSMAGAASKALAPGRAHFTLQGAPLSLEPVLEGEQLFFVFKDKTAPKETYGGGRFLYAKRPEGGAVVLDFNRAINPPCVFTPYATCPVPLPQNVLPVRVEAGEKKWQE